MPRLRTKEQWDAAPKMYLVNRVDPRIVIPATVEYAGGSYHDVMVGPGDGYNSFDSNEWELLSDPPETYRKMLSPEVIGIPEDTQKVLTAFREFIGTIETD